MLWPQAQRTYRSGEGRLMLRTEVGQDAGLRCLFCCGMDVPLEDDAVRPDDQQASQRPLPHLRLGPEALLALGRMLP